MSVCRAFGLPAVLVLLSTSMALAAGSPARWGSPGQGPGQLSSPAAVAVRGDRVYVADFDNDRVQAFTRDGEPLFAFGSSGVEPGRLRGPAGLAIDRDGRVLVADHYNHRIQRFGADGEYLDGWPAGDAEAAPLGVAVDPSGRVYATDLVAGRVRVWSPAGVLVAEWGGLAEPWGIAASGEGDVWVADHAAHRLVRFGPAGETRADIGGASQAGWMVGPMGVAIAGDGSILASDLAGARIQRFGPDGSRLGATGGDPAEPGGPIMGLVVTGAEIFAADAGNSQIVRLGVPGTGGTGPGRFALSWVRPTPSHGSVTLGFTVPSRGSVRFQVFTLAGRRIWTSAPEPAEAGEHHVTWSGLDERGRPVAAGVYFVRVLFDDGIRRVTRDGRIVVIR